MSISLKFIYIPYKVNKIIVLIYYQKHDCKLKKVLVFIYVLTLMYILLCIQIIF